LEQAEDPNRKEGTYKEKVKVKAEGEGEKVKEGWKENLSIPGGVFGKERGAS